MRNKFVKGLALALAVSTAFTGMPASGLLGGAVEAEAASNVKITGKKSVYVGKNKYTLKGLTKGGYIKIAVAGKAKKNVTVNKKTGKLVKVNAKKVKLTVKSAKKAVGKAYTLKVTAYNKKGKKLKTVKISSKVYNKTTSLTLKAAKSSIKVGEKTTIKATVKPTKNTMPLTYKTSNAKVATVKNGTVTGVGEGTATITVTSGTVKKTVKITVTKKAADTSSKPADTSSKAADTSSKPVDTSSKPADTSSKADDSSTAPAVVEITGVKLDKTTPKVGDIITASVEPENATNVTYAWFMGNSKDGLTDAITGATTKNLQVTEAMVGKYLGVVVSGENNSSANASTAVAVQKADASEIAIVDAKQTGKNKVLVTFNKGITAEDKITVTKGSTAKDCTVEFVDDTFSSATLTMADNLSAGKYTVTLTPANTEVKATSVEFEAISATKATRIGFTNNYLVMADISYTKGYAFLTGYNAFDESIPLTGVQITAAPADKDGVSYDSTTGKVTVKYGADNTGGNSGTTFAVVQKVSMFAQYTGTDGEVLTTQATLDVTTVGYPSEIKFGEVKKDGTPRPDGKITIAELGSNKYYVPIEEVKDQYGNNMAAEDLNDLVTGDTKLVTVIPTDESPIYFGTNKSPFTTVNDKPAIFINGVKNGMPGVGNLMVTGAGGTFSKEIQIWDNPFIDTLSMDVPDIYSNEETDEFTFSAVDQYGYDIDLYDFCPEPGKGTDGKLNGELVFGDKNHTTNMSTHIDAPKETSEWFVKKDTLKKTFKVTFKTTAAAKSIIAFTKITAGMNGTQVTTVTVGELGAPVSIVSPASSFQVEKFKDETFNFAKNIKFKDANGKEMDRLALGRSNQKLGERYPVYTSTVTGGNVVSSFGTNDSSTSVDEYCWTVTDNKVTVGGKFAVDDDGVIVNRKVGNSVFYVNGEDNNKSFYATLFAKSGSKYKILDSKQFRVTYAPTTSTTSGSNIKYTVDSTASMLLYAVAATGDNSVITKTVKGESGNDVEVLDFEEINITATNDAGESWREDGSQIRLVPSGSDFTAVKNKIWYTGDKLADNTTDTVNVKVYFNGKAVDTVSIKYSNVKPVATTTEVKINANDVMEGGYTANLTDDKKYDFTTKTSRFVVADKSSVSYKRAGAYVDKGQLVINNINQFGDQLIAQVKDQYDMTMNAKISRNGENVPDMTTGTPYSFVEGEHNFVVASGNQAVDLDVTAKKFVAPSNQNNQ